MNPSRIKSPMALIFGAALGALAALPANAQEIDCTNPQDQSSMTHCAFEAWKEADRKLNASWKVIIARAIEADESMKSWGGDDRPGHEETLRVAQRAWITFRDAQCEFEGFEARGGTMEPMLVGFCLKDLTKERTRQLDEVWGMDR